MVHGSSSSCGPASVARSEGVTVHVRSVPMSSVTFSHSLVVRQSADPTPSLHPIVSRRTTSGLVTCSLCRRLPIHCRRDLDRLRCWTGDEKRWGEQRDEDKDGVKSDTDASGSPAILELPDRGIASRSAASTRPYDAYRSSTA